MDSMGQQEHLALLNKGLAIVESCQTSEHCLVTHNWMNLAMPQLDEVHQHTLNEAYLNKILKVTGVIE